MEKTFVIHFLMQQRVQWNPFGIIKNPFYQNVSRAVGYRVNRNINQTSCEDGSSYKNISRQVLSQERRLTLVDSEPRPDVPFSDSETLGTNADKLGSLEVVPDACWRAEDVS